MPFQGNHESEPLDHVLRTLIHGACGKMIEPQNLLTFNSQMLRSKCERNPSLHTVYLLSQDLLVINDFKA